MTEKINKAILTLKSQEISFVAVNEGVYTSDKKGVAPILELIEKNPSMLSKSAVADKIIGAAAAFLLVKCGVSHVYGEIMSEEAVSVLNRYHIPYSCGSLVPFIKNRRGDGLCPMEQLCLSAKTPDEAYEKIREFVRKK